MKLLLNAYTIIILCYSSTALLTNLLKSRCNSTRKTSFNGGSLPIPINDSNKHSLERKTRLFCSDSSVIAQGINENSSSSLMRSPSYKDLIAFGVPTLGIWLLQPILSLIDTAAIGMSSTKSTNIAELAAIGPGIAWVDSTAYLCQFLGMATTNLYAVTLGENNTKKSVTVLSHATFLSIILGILLTMIQLIYAKPVITVISGTSKEIIPFAIRYSKYRSFGSLVAIPTIIAQSAFLTQKNVLVPLVAVLIGAVVNILGDGFYVMYLKQGLKGAAIASTLSQCASFLYLVYIVLQNIRKMQNITNTKSNNNSDIESPQVSSSSFFSQSMRTKIQSFVQLPSFNDIRQFMSFSGPLFFILLAKSFLWSFTTYACSTAGATKLAAHQITINFYLFFVIFGDVTSQMSQTYLPSLFNKLETLRNDSKNRHRNNNSITNSSNSNGNVFDRGDKSQTNYNSYQSRLLNTVSKIVTIAVAIGVVNSGVGYFLQTSGAKMFTKSSEILAAMYSIRYYFVLCVLPFALVAAMEGALVAGRDSIFHAVSYLVTGIGFIGYQQYVRTHGLGLIGVWRGFAVLQWWRLFLFGSRVYMKFLLHPCRGDIRIIIDDVNTRLKSS